MISKDSNLDEITESGSYIVQADHPLFKTGCTLMIFKYERYIQQIVFSIAGNYVQYRFKGYSGDWYNWMRATLSPVVYP